MAECTHEASPQKRTRREPRSSKADCATSAEARLQQSPSGFHRQYHEVLFPPAPSPHTSTTSGFRAETPERRTNRKRSGRRWLRRVQSEGPALRLQEGCACALCWSPRRGLGAKTRKHATVKAQYSFYINKTVTVII